MVIAMRIKMQGFIVFDFAAQYASARKELVQWLAEGKLQRKETIIKGGLKVAEQALLDLFQGINTGISSLALRSRVNADLVAGKLLVEVKAEDFQNGVGSRL